MQETQETRVQSLGWEYPLEKEMATHSRTLAWKIPWMEEPGRLKSMESHSRTGLSNFTGTGQYSCLENPMDRGAWRATVHGVAKESDTTEQLTHTQQCASVCFS